MENRLIIFDTTLRDGEQAPGFSMTSQQKLQMAVQLERLGVDIIEAGFPIASEGDFESVQKVSGQIKNCTIAALSRAKKEDIDRAWEALKKAKVPLIHTFIATSDIHLTHKLKMSRQEVLDRAAESVRYAATLADLVEFSAEDAVRSDMGFLCQVLEAVIESGAGIVNIPDTVGYSMPDEFSRMIRTILEKVPNIKKVRLSVHCHDDLGMAVANSIAAVQNGAGQVECTINGIGERAGNASLEEVVMILHTRKDLFSVRTGVKTTELFKSSQLLTHLTGIPVQRNKAVVGANAFAHEAGIHQDGVLKNAMTYEIMTPQSVGISQNILVLGKHSGRHALAKRFSDLGYDLTREELNRIYTAFTDLADKKKVVYDADLLAIYQEKISEIPEIYELKGMQVISGSNLTPTATVRLSRGDEILEDSSIGDGPVDASYRAVDRLTGMSCKLIQYSLNAVTQGKDALGEVLVKIEYNGSFYAGHATSTDIVEASVKAYLYAVNRAVYDQKRKENDKVALDG